MQTPRLLRLRGAGSKAPGSCWKTSEWRHFSATPWVRFSPAAPKPPPGLISSGCLIRALLSPRDASFCPAGWEQGGPPLGQVREEEEGEQGKGSGSVPRAGEPGGLPAHSLRG